MKEKTKGALFFCGMLIAAPFIFTVRVVFSIIKNILKDCKKEIVMFGLTAKQRKLLDVLAKRKALCFSGDDDGIEDPAFEKFHQYIKQRMEIEQIEEACRQAGIGEWRIKQFLK